MLKLKSSKLKLTCFILIIAMMTLSMPVFANEESMIEVDSIIFAETVDCCEGVLELIDGEIMPEPNGDIIGGILCLLGHNWVSSTTLTSTERRTKVAQGCEVEVKTYTTKTWCSRRDSYIFCLWTQPDSTSESITVIKSHSWSSYIPHYCGGCGYNVYG